ncbi:sensor histidine kinase [Uliginosibacterium gangwonense]|uniref:sensor histidine kinase n=1 Tax=Uliginosibacterium gangwonense TaxID=392736 RepID=UPI00037133E9|nr:ATP-binding protein [Uliginosibacterium gangwonense]
MPIQFIGHLHWPRSLRWQFALVLAAFAVLIVAGSLATVYTLRVSADTARQLAEKSLVRMQQARDLVQESLLIERETLRMLAADSPADVRTSYANTIKQLDSLDSLVTRLGEDRADAVVLSLHQSNQLFRNTVHIMAQLHEGTQRANTAFDQSVQKNIQTLQKYSDPAAQKLIVLLYRLGKADHATEVDALRNQFMLQARSIHPLPQTAYQDPPSASDDTNEAQAPANLSPFTLRIKLIQQQDNLRHFRGELQRQVSTIATTARELSQHFTNDYHETVKMLDTISQRTQFLVLGLLGGCLTLGLLVARYFIGRHILARLQKISQYLQQNPATETQARIPVQGSDEIGSMARIIEQFTLERRQLADAQRQLLQADKMSSVGQLAGGVANKINAPVNYVTANLSTLREYANNLFKVLAFYEANENELQEKTRFAIKRMKREINIDFLHDDMISLLSQTEGGLQQVKSILQDLRDFSHGANADKQWANLEQVLDHTLNITSHELKHKIEVFKEYAGIPEIQCIPSRLNQVFMNLLVNAAHAIEGYGKITLRTGLHENNVWAEVEDNGCGIPPEVLSHIFDPFAPSSTSKGTGFGLPMAYDIIQQHGGTITVKSKVGTGTVFRVTLPIKTET